MRIIKNQLDNIYALPVKFDINHLIVNKGLVLLGQGKDPKTIINTIIDPIKNALNILYKNIDMNFVALSPKSIDQFVSNSDINSNKRIDLIFTCQDYAYVFECESFSITDSETIIGFCNRTEFDLMADLLDELEINYELYESAYEYLISIPIECNEVSLHFHMENETEYKFKYIDDENEDNKNLN